MRKNDKTIQINKTITLDGRAVDRNTSAHLVDGPGDKTISVRLGGKYIKILNELRRKEEDVPTQSEMVRRLIEKTASAS